jgi:hypothetical protein
MSKSFFNGCRDSELAVASRCFAEKIAPSPETYGISPAMAEAYGEVDARWQEAYAKTTNPSTRTSGAVIGKNQARAEVIAMASSLAKIICGNPQVSHAQRIGLALSVRDLPSPLPAPGKPFSLKTMLDGDGSLIVTWKCDNPRGSRGTTYEIWRQVNGGPREFIRTVGTKRYRDAGLPVGVTGLVYHIRAVRSTKVGAWSLFPVSIGGGIPNLMDRALAA